MATLIEQLAEELKEVGTRLLSPPPSVDNLLPLLDEVEHHLELVEQSPSQTMLDALSPSMNALVAPELLGHSDSDVNVSVATCISEITRITAPDAPYSDDQMKEIFQLIVSSFEKLLDTSSRSYNKRITMLETVAKVRSCVMMLDLECDDLILQMFQHFLKSVRDFHPEKVHSSMETIMTLVLEESEDISPELLSSILEYLKKDDKNVDPIARRLGENVLSKCSSKVKPYLVQAIQTLGLSLDDYSNVVASVCQDLSGAMDINGVNVENISEVKETLKDTASQTEVSPAPDAPKSTMTNGNLQKVVEEAEVVKERSTEQKCDDHTESNASEESDTIKDEVELIVKPQTEEKSNKKRGRKGNFSKTTLEPSEATPAEEDNDVEKVTDLQESESKDSVSLHSKDTPADKKRGRKGNLSKNALEPSEATHIEEEEDNDAEKVTDLQKSESKGGVSLHSKDMPADKKRGRKGIFLKTTLEPSEATPAEEDNDAEGGTDLQEREGKGSGSLHSTDTPDKRRGRKGNLSKITLEPSEATPAEEHIDAEEGTDLQENESKGSASLHSKDTPTDKRRGRKGNLSKTTLEPSEATPAEEHIDAEEGTDLQENESKGSASFHSKDTPTDKRRGRKGNLSKTTLEPSEATTAEEDNDAEEVNDLQGSESKDSGSLHSKDITADNTPSPNREKGADISHPLSTASENKTLDIPSPSPSGHTTDESPLKKADRGNNTEVVIEEVTTLPEDDSKMESEADVSELKADKVTGQEISSATDKEENTLGPVDATRNDDGSTIGSDTKTTKLSGEKVESMSDEQDAKKIKAQGKTPLVKDRVKSPPKKECKESGSSTKVATKSAKKGSYTASSKKGSDQKNPNRKRAAGKEEASETAELGEELVGCKIKVWWPKDKTFYEGVVESFSPDSKRHKILYTDGDVEVLNMKAQKWEFNKDDEKSRKASLSDGENPEASSERHKKKKIKTNPEPSNKQGKSLSANKKKFGGTSSRRLKVAVRKPGSKLSDEMDVDKTSDDEDAKESGESEGEKDGKSSDANSGDESMDETPKRAGKSKEDEVETPKASTKSKQQTTKCYSRSKGKTATGAGSKTNPNRTGKAKAGSSSSKGKETAVGKQSQHESAKTSQSGKSKSSNISTKAQKVETKSGKKRKRGSSKK